MPGIYQNKYKPVCPGIDEEASSKYIDEEVGTITYTGDCEWSKFLDEESSRGNYDLIECVSALREIGCISIWPATGFESVVRQIKAVRRLPYYNEIVYTIREMYADFPDFLFVELQEIILREQKSIHDVIRGLYKDNTDLFRVSPRRFEEIVAELLYADDFMVRLTSQTRDDGYDIEAIKNICGIDVRFLIECKRNLKSPTGIRVIRSFNDVLMRERANKGIIITTSYFTKGAWERKYEMSHLLDLKEREDLFAWIERYCCRGNTRCV
jgi:HJR/Mrr/RecB family endonuclease